jgi:hypothetical protein
MEDFRIKFSSSAIIKFIILLISFSLDGVEKLFVFDLSGDLIHENKSELKVSTTEKIRIFLSKVFSEYFLTT